MSSGNVITTRRSLGSRADNLPLEEFNRQRIVGVVSDTHGLIRETVLATLQDVDLILHAGDIGSADVLETLRRVAPVIAVKGNIDHQYPGLADGELIRINGDLIYLWHDLGTLDLNPLVAGIRIVITGHSHQPQLREQGGVIYLNPGSVGPRRFRNPISMAKLRWPAGIVKAELIQLGE